MLCQNLLWHTSTIFGKLLDSSPLLQKLENTSNHTFPPPIGFSNHSQPPKCQDPWRDIWGRCRYHFWYSPPSMHHCHHQTPLSHSFQTAPNYPHIFLWLSGAPYTSASTSIGTAFSSMTQSWFLSRCPPYQLAPTCCRLRHPCFENFGLPTSSNTFQTAYQAGNTCMAFPDVLKVVLYGQPQPFLNNR